MYCLSSSSKVDHSNPVNLYILYKTIYWREKYLAIWPERSIWGILLWQIAKAVLINKMKSRVLVVTLMLADLILTKSRINHHLPK